MLLNGRRSWDCISRNPGMSSHHSSAIMQQEKRRKCGPRVKTGCITCRIRRVKCDEGKPACQRCVSTGRKCDGYATPKVENQVIPLSPVEESGQLIRTMSPSYAIQFSVPGDERDRQNFHFYCVQSAFDLSVYLNSSFWYDMILQYSQHQPAVRQAVIAFGASHLYAMSLNQRTDHTSGLEENYEQVVQYDKAIRSLRHYMETEAQPDPHVILICCALFFSCENSRGHRIAALKHLENGLHILRKGEERRGIESEILLPTPKEDRRRDSVASDWLILRPKSTRPVIDEELLYVFSRLDCQATLCHDLRTPVLNLSNYLDPSREGSDTLSGNFTSITDAQRTLDLLHNRLARFLTMAIPYSKTPAGELPAWVVESKKELHDLCAWWEEAMRSFIATQPTQIRDILAHEKVKSPQTDPRWQIATQIQLLNLHHRCWWMLFRSSYPSNPKVFTTYPNRRADEIIDICEFLAFALPLRPSITSTFNEADMNWKMISEIGVTAPLFVCAIKCANTPVRDRAIALLKCIRDSKSGLYDEIFLARVVEGIEASILAENDYERSQSPVTSFSSPQSTVHENHHACAISDDDKIVGHDKIGLMGWSRIPALDGRLY